MTKLARLLTSLSMAIALSFSSAAWAYPYLDYLVDRVEVASGKAAPEVDLLRSFLAAELSDDPLSVTEYHALLMDPTSDKSKDWAAVALARNPGTAKDFYDVDIALIVRVWGKIKSENLPAEQATQLHGIEMWNHVEASQSLNMNRWIPVYERKLPPGSPNFHRNVLMRLIDPTQAGTLDPATGELLLRGHRGEWTHEELAAVHSRLLALVSAPQPTEPSVRLGTPQTALEMHLCLVQYPPTPEYLSAFLSTSLGRYAAQSVASESPTESALVQELITRLELARKDLSDHGRHYAGMMASQIVFPHRSDPRVQEFLVRCVNESFGAFQPCAPQLVACLEALPVVTEDSLQLGLPRWTSELKTAVDHVPEKK